MRLVWIVPIAGRLLVSASDFAAICVFPDIDASNELRIIHDTYRDAIIIGNPTAKTFWTSIPIRHGGSLTLQP